MSHLNPTIAQVMRQVMLDRGRDAIMRADHDLLSECAWRCFHTSLASAGRKEQGRRIFQAVALSPLFVQEKIGGKCEYTLLERIEQYEISHT